MRKPIVICLVLAFTILRLCSGQIGVCYITTSQVLVQSYYVPTSYTYQYDCSTFEWGWSYCTAIAYTSSLSYSSSTSYAAQFACCSGYQQVGTTQTCADINECASNGGLGPCQQNCTNTVGSYYCSCLPGYTLSTNGAICNDINECASNGGLGPCQQNCTNAVGSFYCSCLPGYTQSAIGTSCNDINECDSNGGLGPCQQNCTNTVGSFYCSCLPGYTLSTNGTSCNDINECASSEGLEPCQQNCTNTVGSYYCSCLPGYTLSANGASCNDINECASNEGLGPCQQNCTNTVGSYYCSCLPGYTLSTNGTSCNVHSFATPCCMTSSMDGRVELITPTTAQSSNHAMMTSPSVTQITPNTVYAQVQFLNAVNCTSFTIPAAVKLLQKSVIENVNGYCKCNFSIENAVVICFGISRVTLRGTVRLIQLPYLQNWVVSVVTTIYLQGSMLKVDNGCPVHIQSLGDPECPIGNVSATGAVGRDTTGLSLGIAFGGMAVVATIVVVIAVLFIKLKKSTGYQTISNPLYIDTTSEHVYDQVSEYSSVCGVPQPAEGNTLRNVHN